MVDLRRIMPNLRASMRRSTSTPVLAFATFGLAATFWAYHRVNPLLFNPTNGDFQTFNPISRLLAGQFPYHEFANYLGLGPLALTTIAAAPVGLNFATSVMATEILVSLAFLYMATTASRLLGTPRPWLFAVVLYLVGKLGFFMELLPTSPLSLDLQNLARELTAYLGLRNLVSPGHSLMPLRVLWPFLAALPLLVYLKRPSLQRAAILGAALGAGLLWSNDYGPTTALAFGLVAGFTSRNLRHIILALGVSLVVAGMAVFAVTGGHPIDWVNFNRAVAQDQFWYYYLPSKKIASVDMIDLDATTWLLLFVLVVGIDVLQTTLRSRTPEALTFFSIFVTATLASLLSLFGSAWLSNYLTGPAFLCVAYLTSKTAPWLRLRINPDGPVSRAGFAILALGLGTGFLLHPTIPPASADEVTLGAKLDQQLDGFDDLMAHIRAGDTNVWSTYATAVEASLGIHQPTGQDYIIHALGDAGRQKYLDGFRQAAPQTVITPRPDKILWEVWSRYVNWWFYRELLLNYEPVTRGAYWTIWQRVQPTQATVSVPCDIHQEAPGSVRITVNGGKPLARHITDVRLTYSAEAPAFARVVLEVFSNTQAGSLPVGLPPGVDGWHIPMELDEHGTGTSTVHANLRSPRGARLTVHECEARAWVPAGRIDQ
jgi:hypothetical protein